MAVEITGGEVAAINFMAALKKAPSDVRARFEELKSSGNWPAYADLATPLLRQMKLPGFSAAEMAEVAPLSDPQRQVYLFYSGISQPSLAAVKDRIDTLRQWGAWESIAALVSSNPKIPFQFTAADIKRVFDPAGAQPDMSRGEAEAKTFLNTVNAEPKLAAVKERIERLIKWGGFEGVAAIVSKQENIPFKFSGEDVRRVADPAGTITPRSVDETARMEGVQAFYTALKTKPELASALTSVQQRIEHGCFKSIADIINNIKDFPVTGLDGPLVKSVLDPDNQRGNDDACAALAPPEPSDFAKGIGATIGAGLATWAFMQDAGGAVADWTTGAAGDVADWTEGAAGEVGDWTVGAAGDVADWTLGAADTAFGGIVNIATDAGSWLSGAGSVVTVGVSDAANSAADWTKGAANAVGDAVSSVY